MPAGQRGCGASVAAGQRGWGPAWLEARVWCRRGRLGAGGRQINYDGVPAEGPDGEQGYPVVVQHVNPDGAAASACVRAQARSGEGQEGDGIGGKGRNWVC